jgi:hypothetical protein
MESNSPYSPDFPSTPSVYDDGFDSQPQVYQTGEADYQICASVDSDYDYRTANDFSSCSSTVPFSSGLPLHAPIPLPGQSPLLRSDSHKFNYPSFGLPQSPPHQSPVNYISQPAPVAAHDAAQNPVNTGHLYEDPAQITFPTPSELLVELSGRGSTTDQLRVEKKSETRKARRRAIAKSVGFVPTDPFVEVSLRSLHAASNMCLQ